MALRFDAARESLRRTTGLFLNQIWSGSVWARRIASSPWGVICYETNDNDSAYYDGIQINESGTELIWTSVAGNLSLGTPAVDTWFWVGWIRNGFSSVVCYRDTTRYSSASLGDTQLATNLNVGDLQSPAASALFNGRIVAVKLWSAAISEAELLNEKFFFEPIRTANLNTWLPMVDRTVANNAKDQSGSGYDMTVYGTPSVEDGPPIVWGCQRSRRIYIPSGGQSHQAAVAFAASSSFSDSVLADFVKSLSLPGQVSQAEQGLADMLKALTVSAQGGHLPVAAADRQGAISLQGSGAMSDDAARDFPVAGTLSAQAAFSASEIADLLAALQFSGVASLSPAGQLVADLAGTLSSQASFASDWGASTIDAAVGLPAGAGISPAAQRDRLASLSYAALCSIQQALERYVSAALGLSSIADLTAQQVTDLGAQVQIGAQADIDALAQQIAEALAQAGANAQFAAAAAGAFEKAMQFSIAALFASLGSTEELFERLLSLPATLAGADVRLALLAGADARFFELEGSDDRPAILPGGGDA